MFFLLFATSEEVQDDPPLLGQIMYPYFMI